MARIASGLIVISALSPVSMNPGTLTRNVLQVGLSARSGFFVLFCFFPASFFLFFFFLSLSSFLYIFFAARKLASRSQERRCKMSEDKFQSASQNTKEGGWEGGGGEE